MFGSCQGVVGYMLDSVSSHCIVVKVHSFFPNVVTDSLSPLNVI